MTVWANNKPFAGSIPNKSVSLKELEQYDGAYLNKSGRQWTVIYGLVYDITAWSSLHPGGSKVIQMISGRDATYMIEAYHNAPSQLNKVLSIITNEKHGIKLVGKFQPTRDETKRAPFDPMKLPTNGPNEFYRTLRQRVHEFVQEHKYSYHGNSSWRETIFNYSDPVISFMLYLVTGILMMYDYPLTLITYLFVLLHATLTVRLGFLMHCALHRVYPYNWINDICGSFMDIIGANSDMWLLKHQVLHHFAPNILGIDLDVTSGGPLSRLHPKAVYHPLLHHFQFLYLPVLMSLVGAIWMIHDTVGAVLYMASYPALTYRFHSDKYQAYCNLNTFGIVRFILGKAWFFSFHFGLKWWLVDAEQASNSYLTMTVYALATGFGLAGTFILNHTQNDLFAENDVKHNRFYHWTVLNTRNSANWSSGSIFWNFMSGGLNHQIEHHLFPSMHPSLYPSISPIVKQTCAEFKVPYVDVGNLYQASCGVIAHLFQAGSHE